MTQQRRAALDRALETRKTRSHGHTLLAIVEFGDYSTGNESQWRVRSRGVTCDFISVLKGPLAAEGEL